jgi:hypothetical protein
MENRPIRKFTFLNMTLPQTRFNFARQKATRFIFVASVNLFLGALLINTRRSCASFVTRFAARPKVWRDEGLVTSPSLKSCTAASRAPPTSSLLSSCSSLGDK